MGTTMYGEEMGKEMVKQERTLTWVAMFKDTLYAEMGI